MSKQNRRSDDLTWFTTRVVVRRLFRRLYFPIDG